MQIDLPSTGSADVSGHLEEPICLDRIGMPRIYLLGHPKSGTTTMASDLHSAGARFFKQKKESGLFNNICGFDNCKFHYNMSGCPQPTEGEKQKVLGELKSHDMRCSPGGTIVEATPINARFHGLPAFMSGLYGGQASRLGFVLLYREPLARLQSHWCMRRHMLILAPNTPAGSSSRDATLVGSFKGYMSIQKGRMEWYKAKNYAGLALEKDLDMVYESLYSLALEGWLAAFRSDQFAIFPMGSYMGSSTLRTAALGLLQEKFSVTLSPERLGNTVTHKFPGKHHDLLEDLDNATITHWYTEYFGPDLRRLAGLLAEHVRYGLSIGGYSGPGGDAAEMFGHLCKALSCFMA